MAVLVEGISIVVRRDRIENTYPGGWQAFALDCRNSTLCTDGELARFGFMSPQDVQSEVGRLEQMGLTFLAGNQATDLTVVDQLRGSTVPCPWLQFARLKFGDAGGRISVAWLFEEPQVASGLHFKGTADFQLATPSGWRYEESLSHRFGFVPLEGVTDTTNFLTDEAFEIATDDTHGAPALLINRAHPGGAPGKTAAPVNASGSVSGHPATGIRHVAEMMVVTSVVRQIGRPPERGADMFAFDDDTMGLLEELLAPYNQNPHWFFDVFLTDNRPTPWAIVCLHREARIARHIREVRGADTEGIRFAPFTQVPRPVPPDFEPAVGVLLVYNRDAFATAAARSPLLQSAWGALLDRDPNQHWIVLLGPTDRPWLEDQEERPAEQKPA